MGKAAFLFGNFLFAHLVAEFVAHTEKLWAWEKRSTWGLLAHAAIYAGVSVVLFLPLLNQGLMWWYIIFLASLHVFLDRVRLGLLEARKDPDAVFVLQQGAHLFWMIFLTWYGRRPDAIDTGSMWLRLPGYPGWVLPAILCAGAVVAARDAVRAQFSGARR